VGGGYEPPFGAAGGSAAALEVVGVSVVLDVREDRFDHRLALFVERAPGVAFEDAAHEGVEPAVSSGSGGAALERFGTHQRLDALVDDVLDVVLFPIAGVGDDNVGLLGDAGRS